MKTGQFRLTPHALRLTLSLLSLAPLLLCSPAIVFSQQTWQRTYGETSLDYGYAVLQTTDGGYLVTGITFSFGAGGDVYLVKTDAQGDTLWTKTYGGSGEECGNDLQPTWDGGYIVVGTTTSFGAGEKDVYLLKLNAQGDTLWARTYGGANNDFGITVRQTRDSGFVMAGYTNSTGAGDYDVFLIKTDSRGDTLWTKTFGGLYEDVGYSALQTSDGGYIIAGWTYSFGAGMEDLYLIRTDAQGDTLWTKAYGGPLIDCSYSVQMTSDSGFINTGVTSFGSGGGDLWLLKTDAQGDTLWAKAYRGKSVTFGNSVYPTRDGGYIAVGNTDDVYLLKADARGDSLWSRIYGNPNITFSDAGYSVLQTTDGGYIIAGYTMIASCNTDVYLIKTDSLGRSTGVEETAEVRGQRLEVRITATPNPFASFARVPGHERERFALYDIAGRKVGTYRGDRIGEGLGAGVYFLAPEGKDAKPLRIVKLR